MGWMWDEVVSALPAGLATPLVAGTLFSIVSLNVVVYLARSFKRDGFKNSFGNIITGSVSILSNKDSVLKREHVRHSMDGYDHLYKGARKEVGSLHQEESIRTRRKEYKSLVNSFYDLVTDFYEWGWGQVSAVIANHVEITTRATRHRWGVVGRSLFAAFSPFYQLGWLHLA
jgi:hypothetical protein